MIIKEIEDKIPLSDKPITKSIAKTNAYNLIGIGLKKGVELKEHITTIPAKLIVIKGIVQYKTADQIITLHQYESHDIPINEKHAVIAIENSLCFLLKG